jgi:hypothetical protein
LNLIEFIQNDRQFSPTQLMSGIAITLSGGATGIRTTDSNGNYCFTGLNSSGNYTVTPLQPGTLFTPSNQMFNNLVSDKTANFTAFGTSPTGKATFDFDGDGKSDEYQNSVF